MMTTATHTIRNSEDLGALVMHLGNMVQPFTVTTSTGSKRSDEQNRTIHKWFGEIAAQRQDVTAIEVKAECNLEFGLPIMQRDDPEWMTVFGYLFRGLNHEQKLKAIRVLDIPFTRRMKVKQLTEYMNNMVQQATERGHVLTIPEER